MITPKQGHELCDVEVFVQGAEKVGKVTQVLVDDGTGRPEWAKVATGLLQKEHYVPLSVSWVDADGRLVLPVSSDAVHHAPAVGAQDGTLSPDDVQALYTHYGVPAGDELREDLASADSAHASTQDAPLRRQATHDTGATPIDVADAS